MMKLNLRVLRHTKFYQWKTRTPGEVKRKKETTQTLQVEVNDGEAYGKMSPLERMNTNKHNFPKKWVDVPVVDTFETIELGLEK